MEAKEEYNKESIDRLYLYPDCKSHCGILSSLEDWKPNEYLPEGWMYKDKKDRSSHIILEDNDGRRFNSYLAAAKYMELSGKYSKVVINRLLFYPDGKNHKQYKMSAKWMTNKYLPEGWKCKAMKEKSSHINVMARDGTKLTSYTAAASYMELDSGYSEVEKDKVYFYPDGLNHKKYKTK